MELYDIIEAIAAGRSRFTSHGAIEAAADGLAESEIHHSVFHGEIIEDYPNDQPLPSCLVFGRAPDGNPVHSVWAYNRETRRAAMITVYRPDPERWIDWRARRR